MAWPAQETLWLPVVSNYSKMHTRSAGHKEGNLFSSHEEYGFPHKSPLGNRIATVSHALQLQLPLLREAFHDAVDENLLGSCLSDARPFTLDENFNRMCTHAD